MFQVSGRISMCHHMKKVLFMFIIYNVQLLSCIEVQPMILMNVSNEAMNEHKKIIAEVHIMYNKSNVPNQPKNLDDVKKVTAKKESSKKFHDKLEEPKENGNEENLHEKIMVQPTLTDDQPTEAVKESQSQSPSIMPVSVNNYKETVDKLSQGTVVKLKNTKDVDPGSDIDTARLNEVVLWTEKIPKNNNTELSNSNSSTSSSLLCIENVCSFLTYVILFITPYYYNLGL